MPVPADTVLDALKWRYATKQFDPSKKISDADFGTLADALRLTPSSFGLQPWKFYVVTTQSVKDELHPASWNQNQVKDCSHLIVFAARKNIDAAYVEHFVDTTAKTRGTPREALKGMHDMILGFVQAAPEKLAWSTHQCYIGLGMLMQTAAMLGIDACPMEGLVKADYDRILKVDPDYATAVACPLGYREDGDKYATMKKVRFPASELFVNI